MIIILISRLLYRVFSYKRIYGVFYRVRRVLASRRILYEEEVMDAGGEEKRG